MHAYARTLLFLAFSVLSVLTVSPAVEAQDFSAKPITLVVGFRLKRPHRARDCTAFRRGFKNFSHH